MLMSTSCEELASLLTYESWKSWLWGHESWKASLAPCVGSPVELALDMGVAGKQDQGVCSGDLALALVFWVVVQMRDRCLLPLRHF